MPVLSSGELDCRTGSAHERRTVQVGQPAREEPDPRQDECGFSDWPGLFASLRRRVIAYVRRAVRERADVDDLVAETFARAWLERDTLGADSGSQIIGYAREACREWVREQRHGMSIPLSDERIAPEGASDANTSMSVDAAVRNREWYKRVLGELAPRQRAAVDFRVCWGFSYKFIAAVLDTSEGAVRVDVHRGLRRLRRIVADDPFPLGFDKCEGRSRTPAAEAVWVRESPSRDV
jgi:RNA polymerase sigma-70 factor (ECF subfamily)